MFYVKIFIPISRLLGLGFLYLFCVIIVFVHSESAGKELFLKPVIESSLEINSACWVIQEEGAVWLKPVTEMFAVP